MSVGSGAGRGQGLSRLTRQRRDPSRGRGAAAQGSTRGCWVRDPHAAAFTLLAHVHPGELPAVPARRETAVPPPPPPRAAAEPPPAPPHPWQMRAKAPGQMATSGSRAVPGHGRHLPGVPVTGRPASPLPTQPGLGTCPPAAASAGQGGQQGSPGRARRPCQGGARVVGGHQWGGISSKGERGGGPELLPHTCFQLRTTGVVCLDSAGGQGGPPSPQRPPAGMTPPTGRSQPGPRQPPPPAPFASHFHEKGAGQVES